MHPDFRTIADFRKTHLAALQGFFEQVLRLARELGAPRMGRVALDGSKVKANASKHKAMSYDRMRDKQRQLREEVKQLLAQAEAADAAEDAEYGPIGAATSCRRNCSDARVGWSGFARRNGPWRRAPKTRPPPPDSRPTRPSRTRRRNITSPIPSRGS